MKNILLFVLVGTVLAACNSAAPGAKGALVEVPDVTTTANDSKVYFDTFAAIPKVATPSNYIIRLHNDSNDSYQIVSATLSPLLVSDKNKALATLDKNNCSTITRHSQCGFILNFPANNTASYTLTTVVEDSSHKQHTIKSFLISDQNKSGANGINYSFLSTVNSHNGIYHLAVPVYFGKDFNKVSVSEGTLYCRNGYHAGSSCTYYKDGQVSKDELLLSKLSAVTADNRDVEVSGKSLISKSGTPFLLMSVPEDVELKPGSAPVKSVISIVNIGNQPATGITIDSSKLAAGVTLLPAGCGTDLAAYGNCNIEISYNGVSTNGSSILKLSHDYTSAKRTLVQQFMHIINRDEPALEWDNPPSNIFEGSVVHDEVSETFILKAKNIKFSAIKLSHDSNSDFTVAADPAGLCKGNQISIASDGSEECHITISYKPMTQLANPAIFYITATGSYIDATDTERSLAYPLALSYSAPFTPASLIQINDGNKIELKTIAGEPKDFVIKIENNSKYSISLGSPVFTPAIPDATIADPAKCLTIAPQSSCELSVNYDPKATMVNSMMSSLRLQVIKLNNNDISATSEFATSVVEYAAVSPSKPSLVVSFDKVSGNQTQDVSGYWVHKDNTIEFSYKATNTGDGIAKNISVTSSNGWTIDDTNCQSRQLSKGDSCQVKFSHAYSSVGQQELKEQDVTISYGYGNANDTDSIKLGTDTKNVVVYQMPNLIHVSGAIGQLDDVFPGSKLTTTFRIDDGYPGMPGYEVKIAHSIDINSDGLIWNNPSCTLDYQKMTCDILTDTDYSLLGESRKASFVSTGGLSLSNKDLNIKFRDFAVVGDNRPADFVRNGKCVLDKITGLMWPTDPLSDISNKPIRTIKEAMDSIEALNQENFCDYSDWVLPNINELKSLVNYSSSNFPQWLADNNGPNVAGLNRFGFFSSTLGQAGRYIVFSLHENIPYFPLSFLGVGSYLLPVRHDSTVKPIVTIWKTGQTNPFGVTGSDGETQRGKERPSVPFEDVKSDPRCVKDNSTGKIWFKTLIPSGKYSALLKTVQDYNHMTMCGVTGWHVATINEYHSLQNYGEDGTFTYLKRYGLDLETNSGVYNFTGNVINSGGKLSMIRFDFAAIRVRNTDITNTDGEVDAGGDAPAVLVAG
ncbi:DUF1566 domain-containing protein [Aquella oligotrophica]|uniref:Lcl C-terminal domain-containing protein n=1 Tax=Aquella oligotrophica TaxID=2067065 RepID=A0A2I7N648_9NEIS|nr:DUF1566 domain-containing protein [Aquella oligotrophica]AUR51929.1 hypothetical protein CUN60_06335 [Aquella oligotrophica]